MMKLKHDSQSRTKAEIGDGLHDAIEEIKELTILDPDQLVLSLGGDSVYHSRFPTEKLDHAQNIHD